MSKSNVAIDVANGVLSVGWMEVFMYPLRFNKSKSLLRTKSK